MAVVISESDFKHLINHFYLLKHRFQDDKLLILVSRLMIKNYGDIALIEMAKLYESVTGMNEESINKAKQLSNKYNKDTEVSELAAYIVALKEEHKNEH